MPRYAANTAVSSEASRAEIERTLARYGADSFAYGWDQDAAVVAFRMDGRHVRFRLPLPPRTDFEHTPERGMKRSAAAAEKAFEQAVKQRWRALALAIKAKLEAVESGIASFEEEFMAHIMLPDGSTVGDFMAPQIERAYETAEMPSLLPALPPGR